MAAKSRAARFFDIPQLDQRELIEVLVDNVGDIGVSPGSDSVRQRLTNELHSGTVETLFLRTQALFHRPEKNPVAITTYLYYLRESSALPAA